MKTFIDFIKKFWKLIAVAFGFIGTAVVTTILSRKSPTIPLTDAQKAQLNSMPKREAKAKQDYDEALNKSNVERTPQKIIDDFNNKFGGQ